MGWGLAIGLGASVLSGLLGSRSAKKAASAQSSAIANSQQILADSNIKAAELVAAGQHAAAAAIQAAGERAAQATLEAAELGRAQIQKFFEIAQADIQAKWEIADGKLEPFRQQGLMASRELASMMGIEDDTGQTHDFDNSDLEALPQFQFQMEQGTKALDRGSRSKLSGGQYKALTEYGQGLASNVFNDRINQLMGLDQIGVQAGGQLANAAMTAAGQLSSAAINAGGQMGSNYSNQGNTLGNIYSSQGNALASNATAGANALAGLQSQYGSDMANLALGQGSVNANRYTNQSNAWANALNTGAMAYGMYRNPLMGSSDWGTRGTDWGTVQMPKGTARF